MDGLLAFAIAIVPTTGVLFLFWLGFRAMLQADRRERAALARAEAENRRSGSTETPGSTPE